AGILVTHSDVYMNATYDLGIFRCCFGFFAGVVTYRLWARGYQIRGNGSLLEVAVAALLIGYVSLAGDGPSSYASPLIFSVVVLVFAGDRGAICRALRSNPIQLVGKWS